MKNEDIAVSDTISTLLLLVMAISIFSILYISFSFISPSDLKPCVNLIGIIDDNNITLEHRGGGVIDLDAEIVVSINGSNVSRFIVNDYINPESKKDGGWDIGERVVYPASDMTDSIVSVSVVDPSTDSVIMMANLQG